MTNELFTMVVYGHSIEVRERRTGRLVAFSSMKADFEQSMEEFLRDFFPELV